MKNIFKILLIVVVGTTMSLGMYAYKNYVLKPELRGCIYKRL